MDSEEFSSETPQRRTPRARNRTVLMTPEDSGAMRSKIREERTEIVTDDSTFTPYEELSGIRPSSALPLPNRDRANEAQPHLLTPSSKYPEQTTSYNPGKAYQEQLFGYSNGSSSPIQNPSSHQPHGRNDDNTRTVLTPPPSEPLDQESKFGGNERLLSDWVKPTPLVGFLISYDKVPNGEVYDLRVGRLIVSADRAGVTGQSNIMVIPDESVSSNHAVMKIDRSGHIQLVDQLSEHGTFVKRFGDEEWLSVEGERLVVDNGDWIRFGERKFVVCIILVEE